LAKIYEIYRLILINSLLSEIYLLRQVLNWSPKIPSGWKSLVLFLFILLCRLIWNTVTDVFYGRRSWREILYNLYFTLLVYYPFKGLKNKKYSELGPNWQIFTYAYYPPTHCTALTPGLLQKKCQKSVIFPGLVMFFDVFFRKFAKNHKKSQNVTVRE